MVVCLCLSGGFLVDWLIVLVRLFFCVVLVFSCILIWGGFGWFVFWFVDGVDLGLLLA